MTDSNPRSDAGVFVVGTDTGVGKTVVTAGLTGWFREQGRDAVAIKPCQTGYPPDDDSAYVASVCGTAEAATCLRRLEPPLAPEVAAAVSDDATLSYTAVLNDVDEAVEAAGLAFVEGIGGLRVPLADGREVIDLVADVELPALVVARSGLGTLNHTGLTVDALRQRGVPVIGVVLNEHEGATTAERTNPGVIEEMTNCPTWTVPPLDLDRAGAVIDGIRDNLPATILEGITGP